ncbi:hypothetical protein [Sporosarcina sp. NPDC096371]
MWKIDTHGAATRKPFEVGNVVEVVVNVTQKEVEDYYYLKEVQGVHKGTP